MYAMLEAENGLTFNGANTPAGMVILTRARVSMTISRDIMAGIEGYFEKLAAGGKVTQK